MYQRTDIKEGMTVRSADGHKLGKVYAVGESEFHIEKGLFFPKDYAVRYAEISDLRHGEIILAHGKESLRFLSDEVPYGSDTIATREGIGTSPVHHDTAASAELNAGERTGLPFGARPEGVRTQDLGAQPIGPYNTEGARASPILTEEDRGVESTPRRERVPTTRRDITERPSLSASPEEPVGTPLHAEEIEARRRTMMDEEERRRVAETRGDTSVEGTRSLDFTSDDPNKRGF